VWTELGTGDVDFGALFQLLRQKEWSGWVIVETDHTQLGTALESSMVSRRYLRETFGL
jgi:sugar phosphate isomerase/epimerase